MLLSSLLLFLAAQEPAAGLEQPRAAAWSPRHGRVAVLDRGGRRLLLFDVLLRPLGTREVQAERLRFTAGSFWLLDPEGTWRRLDGEGRPGPAEVPGFFLGRLLEEDPSPDGPGGRRLLLEGGRLRWGLAPWEHPGEVEWGPGWAALRFRLFGRPAAVLLARREGEEAWRTLPVAADRGDPLLWRAFLRGTVPGETWEVQLPEPAPSWPPAAPRRILLVVPEVAPGGPRPVEVLPAGPNAG